MKETDKIYPADKGEEELLHNVRHILQEARAKVIHHVNSTLVRAYWQVGKYIVEYEQQGTGRAGYGKAVINTLSRRLVAEFGNGFTATNLRYMRQFYQCYPKYHTLCDKLSWSHCRTLLKVSGDAARDFYLHECVKENWSVRLENPLKVVPLIHSNLTPVKFSHSPFCLFLFSSYSSCPLCRVLH